MIDEISRLIASYQDRGIQPSVVVASYDVMCKVVKEMGRFDCRAAELAYDSLRIRGVPLREVKAPGFRVIE